MVKSFRVISKGYYMVGDVVVFFLDSMKKKGRTENDVFFFGSFFFFSIKSEVFTLISFSVDLFSTRD